MGCADSHNNLLEEEQSIVYQEEVLGFKENSVARVDFTFRKFSRNQELNSRQFEDVVAGLRLVASNRGKSTKITSFYESLKKPDGNYDLKLLLIIGILLGYGKASDKARLLFEVYDLENLHFIRVTDALQMVEDLFDITVNKLPTLVAANQGETDPVKVRIYIDKINYRAKNCKDKLLTTLTEGNELITRDSFVRNMSSPENQHLTTSSGLREYFYRIYQSTPSSTHIEAARKLLESQFAVQPAGSIVESHERGTNEATIK